MSCRGCTRRLARDFPNVRFKADRLFNGPPVGWAVQVRVTGPDRNEVRRLAAEVGDVMRANPQISNVHDDWLEPVPSLKLEIDQDRARALGVTSQNVRRSLQAMLSGFQIGEFRDKDETIKVMLREPSDTRNLLSALDKVYVKTDRGGSVPLRQVANVNIVLEPGIQWRSDRLPSITVRGVVPDGVQSPDVTTAVFAKLKPLRESLPAGYRIEMQGAVEKSAKSQASINEKMPAMLLVILLLLMVQLQHFGKTLMVLATGPARLDRRGGGTACVPGRIRLRCDPWRHRARRDHHAQQRDPGGPDPAGYGGRARCVHGDRRVGGAPVPADHAHGCCSRACPDPACARSVLGTDGAGHDGRADRSDHTDANVFARALCTCIQSTVSEAGGYENHRPIETRVTHRAGLAGSRVRSCRRFGRSPYVEHLIKPIQRASVRPPPKVY